MEGVEREVLERNEERRSALLAKDIGRLRLTMAEDLIFIHTTGKVETREEYIARLAGGALEYHAITETNARTRWLGSALVLVQDVSQDVTIGGQARTLHSVSTSVWSAGSGGWQMRTYQVTTRVPEAAASLPLKWP